MKWINLFGGRIQIGNDKNILNQKWGFSTWHNDYVTPHWLCDYIFRIGDFYIAWH